MLYYCIRVETFLSEFYLALLDTELYYTHFVIKIFKWTESLRFFFGVFVFIDCVHKISLFQSNKKQWETHWFYCILTDFIAFEKRIGCIFIGVDESCSKTCRFQKIFLYDGFFFFSSWSPFYFFFPFWAAGSGFLPSARESCFLMSSNVSISLSITDFSAFWAFRPRTLLPWNTNTQQLTTNQQKHTCIYIKTWAE